MLFFVGDLGDIIRKYKKWIAYLPRVEPFYAVKCNDDPTVLAVLARLGTGFDCASKVEIQKILDLNVSPSRIIYAHPCKQASFLQYAAIHNVNLMTFDNERELYKTKAIFPDAKLVVRIVPPVTDKCIVSLSSKFGCHPKEVPHLLNVAKRLDLDVVGVSFHVGTVCSDATAYSSAVISAREVFDMAESAGFHFDLLDIGGGFPGHALVKTSFEEIVPVLRSATDECFPEEMGVRIIAEPGVYFTKSAFTLAANIIAKRTVTSSYSTSSSPGDAEADPVHMYYVNDGVYGSFNNYQLHHIPLVASVLDPKAMAGKQQYTCSIWGPTCDSIDCVLKECRLPEMEIGEWIIFRDMGAYTLPVGSCFNGMSLPKRYYILSEQDWLQLNSPAAGCLQ